jgi:hypothetical protein
MKKSLFWLLSALAVGGLFSVTACDEEEEDVCAAEDVCPAAQTCFVKSDGTAGCSGISCNNGYNDDGSCKGNSKGAEGDSCTDSNDCNQGLDCYKGFCSSDAHHVDYKYVRLDDLSKKCEAKNGSCGEDPGADIDAIVLKKAGSNDNLKYAASVKAYMRADGKQSAKADNDIATNAERALNKPDSFINYPNSDGVCYYWAKDTSDQRTYVSLGGEGGYLVVQMQDSIEANDVLDVLEVGDCMLWNTTDKPNQEYQKAKDNEEIKIQISISGDDGSWQPVGTGKAANGIISHTITSSMLPQP